MLCTIVKRERLAVDCVSDGAHVIEMLKEHEYSLILLDLMMPRLDGFGVVEYLKNQAPLQKPSATQPALSVPFLVFQRAYCSLLIIERCVPEDVVIRSSRESR